MFQKKFEYDKNDKVKLFYIKTQQQLSQRGGVVGTYPLLIITVLMFLGAAAQSYWPATDPARYQCYALTFWLGSSATHLLPSVQCTFLDLSVTRPAFHMLPREYPPLTLLPFSLPLLVPLPYYQIAFAFLMCVTILLVYWLLLRYGPRGGRSPF
ncbi:hypothetical protein [Dictyobacter kobayashii]|uniref:Uncharacterized protein n=1 Tax=Dictyobacter kobayashii TaxID=2014872 RepID=A0A402ABB1_9CHLR|nr:hypothetical protein [Dictyobacter kobayashii]GCE16275.1 hypothetical protein KDK_00750 [Dictyobacter kobayashii]